MSGIGVAGIGLLSGCAESQSSGSTPPTQEDQQTEAISRVRSQPATDNAPRSDISINRERVFGTSTDVKTYLEKTGLKSPLETIEPQFQQDRLTSPGAAGTGVYYDGNWVGWTSGDAKFPPKLYKERIDWSVFKYELEPGQSKGEPIFYLKNIRPPIVLSTQSAISLVDWQPTTSIDDGCRQAWCRFIAELESHEREHIQIHNASVDALNKEWARISAGTPTFVEAPDENAAYLLAPQEIARTYSLLFDEMIGVEGVKEQENLHKRDGYSEEIHKWGPHWTAFERACRPTEERDCNSRRFIQVKRWHLSASRVTSKTKRTRDNFYRWENNQRKLVGHKTQSHDESTRYHAEFEVVADWSPDEIPAMSDSVKWTNDEDGSGSGSAFISDSQRVETVHADWEDRCWEYNAEMKGDEFESAPTATFVGQGTAKVYLVFSSNEFWFETDPIEVNGFDAQGECSGKKTRRDRTLSLWDMYVSGELPACGYGPITGSTSETIPINEQNDEGKVVQVGEYVITDTWVLSPTQMVDDSVELDCAAI
ncbi:DUF922 domain-containing protein [Halobium palmae]|uniref:DUF922 domain-containing protein n=1 Tax=Halobium palmae TaxID=1776492 RepID=A0ABD5RWV2_9EURY